MKEIQNACDFALGLIRSKKVKNGVAICQAARKYRVDSSDVSHAMHERMLMKKMRQAATEFRREAASGADATRFFDVCREMAPILARHDIEMEI